jgi:GntR family transcriptional regulator, transcriptional repressor for pyruvate dehydrogenase complex
MTVELNELHFQSLKELFIHEIEKMIIFDKFKKGERLPTERELASKMGVSRSVVNAGILDLASKGFLRVVPRKGTFVNDYRTEGTLAIFGTLLRHLGEEMDPELFLNANSARRSLEVECARCAAALRTEADIGILDGLMKAATATEDVKELIAINVDFHHQIAMASRNMVLCILLNAFKDIVKQVLEYFYQIPDAMQQSLDSHALLLEDIRRGDSASAAASMEKIFNDSERIYRDHREREKRRLGTLSSPNPPESVPE